MTPPMATSPARARTSLKNCPASTKPSGTKLSPEKAWRLAAVPYRGGGFRVTRIRPLQPRADPGDEILAAFFKIVILVEAGCRGGQKHGVARARLLHRAGHGAIHRGAGFGLHPAQLHREMRRLAADDIGLGDVLQPRAQTGEPAFLFQPAADPADGGKRLQRLQRGIDIGGLAVGDETHAVLFRDDLATMGQAREAVKALFDRPGREAERARRAVGRAGVLVVVPPGQADDLAQVDGPRLPALAIFGK